MPPKLTRRKFSQMLAVFATGIPVVGVYVPRHEITYNIDYGSGRTTFRVPVYDRPRDWPDWLEW